MYHRVLEKLAVAPLDALIVCDEANKNWLCQKGNYCLPAQMLFTRDKLFVFTTSRNITAISALYPEYQIVSGGLPQLLRLCASLGLKKLGIESRLPLAEYRLCLAALPDAAFVETADIIEVLRMLKQADEIKRLKAATAISDRAFERFLGWLSPGLSECAARNRLQTLLMEEGADSLSFEILLSSGERCLLPHSPPSEKKIARGDMVLIDFGIRAQGYCSDTTRTVFMGTADKLFRERYGLVLRAQTQAIEEIRAGLTAAQADALARDIIVAEAAEGCYDYGLGHGVGVQVHEAPRLRPHSELVLADNMAVSVEPGFYLRGWGGIRIEDVIVIGAGTDGKNLVLSRLPTHLLEL